MLLPTIRQWIAPVITSLLLVTISLALTMYPQAVLAQSSTVSINPTQGPAGTPVTGSGVNWAAGDQMQVSWAENGSILANTTVQPDGTFTIGFNIPSYAGQGGHNIYFTDLSSRYFLVAVFTVSGTTATPTHAAFAYGPVNRIATYGSGTDPVSAQADAEAACQRQGGGSDCQGVGWWTYGYASFAFNASTGNWGWGSDPYQITIADNAALKECGTGCELIYRIGVGGSIFQKNSLSPVHGNFRIGPWGPAL